MSMEAAAPAGSTSMCTEQSKARKSVAWTIFYFNEILRAHDLKTGLLPMYEDEAQLDENEAWSVEGIERRK